MMFLMTDYAASRADTCGLWRDGAIASRARFLTQPYAAVASGITNNTMAMARTRKTLRIDGDKNIHADGSVYINGITMTEPIARGLRECPACGADNRRRAAFCTDCGFDLERFDLRRELYWSRVSAFGLVFAVLCGGLALAPAVMAEHAFFWSVIGAVLLVVAVWLSNPREYDDRDTQGPNRGSNANPHRSDEGADAPASDRQDQGRRQRRGLGQRARAGTRPARAGVVAPTLTGA